MRETMPDTTWLDFLKQRIRERNEIEVAFPSATLWEREQMKDRLRVLRFEIDMAMEHSDEWDGQTYTGEFDEVPW